jgi:hypothetical protein
VIVLSHATITFRSNARNPKTSYRDDLGTSRHETRRSYGRSTDGRSFMGGAQRTRRDVKLGSGINIFGPPSFGTGTVKRR